VSRIILLHPTSSRRAYPEKSGSTASENSIGNGLGIPIKSGIVSSLVAEMQIRFFYIFQFSNDEHHLLGKSEFQAFVKFIEYQNGNSGTIKTEIAHMSGNAAWSSN
jgi:hypothetical protein